MRSRICFANTASAKPRTTCSAASCRHELARCQATAGVGDGEHQVEKATGRIGAGERGHQGRSPKKVVSASARRELVRHMIGKGLSERRALALIHMSANAFRYQPQPERNAKLRDYILALAQRHKR